MGKWRDGGNINIRSKWEKYRVNLPTGCETRRDGHGWTCRICSTASGGGKQKTKKKPELTRCFVKEPRPATGLREQQSQEGQAGLTKPPRCWAAGR